MFGFILFAAVFCVALYGLACLFIYSQQDDLLFIKVRNDPALSARLHATGRH